jgi:UDP-glucose 4-epimerase
LAGGPFEDRLTMGVLVTGAAGFIGSHTVEALFKAGADDVAALDDLSSGKRHNLDSRARFYQTDIRDARAVLAVFEQEKPQALVHLAAQMDVRRSVADPVFDCQINLIGLLNLLEAGRRHGLRRVVFASSGGTVYGEQWCFPCDEDHPCRPLSPYGVAKLASEAYLHFYRAQYGIDYVALRYANVYGPRQDPHGEAGVVAIFCERFLSGATAVIFGDGEQTRDYVFVEDVARANVAALGKAVCGVFNIGTGVETSVNQLYRMLSEVSGIRRAPSFAPARQGEQRRSAISSARAAVALDWHPQVDLCEGLQRTFQYYLSQERRGELAGARTSGLSSSLGESSSAGKRRLRSRSRSR